MATIKITEEYLKSNFDKTIELIKTHVTDQDRQDKMLKLLDDFADRYIVAPASGKKDYHSAFMGGLCYHNLHVLKWAGKFAQTMCPGKYSNQTIFTTVFFHDFGKIGDLENEYYIHQESEWHREKLGEMYKVNKDIQFMKVPHRSLFIAQHYGIQLTQEEYLAILLSDGTHDEINAQYSMKEPDLAMIVHYSDCWATRQEKYDVIIT